MRTARLEGPFGGATEYFNVVLCPGEDVARWCSAVAGGQVVDLVDGKFPVPDVEVGQLAYVGLRRIEPSTQCVLPKQCGWKSQSSAKSKYVQQYIFEEKILDTFVSLVLPRRKNNKILK